MHSPGDDPRLGDVELAPLEERAALYVAVHDELLAALETPATA